MKKYKSLGKGKGGPGNIAPMMPLGMPNSDQSVSLPGGGMQSGQDVGPEARTRLQSMIGDLKNKQGQINAMKFADSNKMDNERQKALMEVFSIMQKSGIDPSNLQQVKEFLDKLQAQNPQLYQVFVSAFEMLMGQQNEAMNQSTIPVTGGALSSMMGQPGNDLSSPPVIPPENSQGQPGDISSMFPGLSK